MCRPNFACRTFAFQRPQALLSLAVPSHHDCTGIKLMRMVDHDRYRRAMLFCFPPLAAGSEWRRRSSVCGTCSPKSARRRPRYATKESWIRCRFSIVVVVVIVAVNCFRRSVLAVCPPPVHRPFRSAWIEVTDFRRVDTCASMAKICRKKDTRKFWHYAHLLLRNQHDVSQHSAFPTRSHFVCSNRCGR